MINNEKWIHTLPQQNIKSSESKEQLDYYRWTKTISKKNNYNSAKMYSAVAFLFIFGLFFVSVVKNQTRNLEKEINFLKTEISGIEFNLNQSLLDNEVITSPANISRLAKEYLGTDLVFYKKKQIINSENHSETIAKITSLNKKNMYKKKVKKLSGNVKYKVAKKIEDKKAEIKKLQELYNNPKSIPREIRTEVGRQIKEKKSTLKTLYDTPNKIFSAERIGRWTIVQVAKVFLGMPVIPGR